MKLYRMGYFVTVSGSEDVRRAVNYKAACDIARDISIGNRTARVYRLSLRDGRLTLVEEAQYVDGI